MTAGWGQAGDSLPQLTESGVQPPTSALGETSRVRLGIQTAKIADVAELADAIDLGSIARQGVEVRVLSSALLNGE